MTNIVVYGKPGCSFCDKAKSLLNIKGLDYQYIDFMDLSGDEGNHVLTELAPGAKTFPIILIDDNYIGGFMELQSKILTVEDIRSKLGKGLVRFIFTKKDGSERELIGTTNSDLIPIDNLPKTTDSESSNKDFFLYKVFEIDNGWRSIIHDSISEVEEYDD